MKFPDKCTNLEASSFRFLSLSLNLLHSTLFREYYSQSSLSALKARLRMSYEMFEIFTCEITCVLALQSANHILCIIMALLPEMLTLIQLLLYFCYYSYCSSSY